ncbi:CLUMA_CG009616, isoform A [Clunio marinus]|uniref:CLUMA_CG009616, isoform A n=1 Tax=Clunio marinus TaxID=568069 RepID=A0A1J1I7M3_9DIPT|nr:CLUMA_CG009616, isoform A [Clunio marinus]
MISFIALLHALFGAWRFVAFKFSTLQRHWNSQMTFNIFEVFNQLVSNNVSISLKLCVLLYLFLIQQIYSQCGQQKILVSRIFGGDSTQPGEYPWLVAFYERRSNTFFCAGSLISQKHILSAAHCFQNKREINKLPPEFVEAHLGKFNLSVQNESNSKKYLIWELIFNFKYLIWELILHPDWDFNHEKFDADLSIAVTKQSIQFSNYIRPVCLPSLSYDEINGIGSVVGWGKSSEYELHAIVPSKLNLPAINASHCYTKFPELAAFSSNRAFCGGFENEGRSPCLGDSGGGFYFDVNDIWIIRGVISASSFDSITGCDINKFSIYTNIPRFVDWITTTMSDTKEIKWIDWMFTCENKFATDIPNDVICEPVNCQEATVRSVKMRIEELFDKSIITNLTILTGRTSSYIPTNIGKLFHKLKTLKIELGDDIKILERETFKDLENLENLDIRMSSVNNIFIADDLLHDLHNLKELTMATKLYLIPMNFLKQARNLRTLKFYPKLQWEHEHIPAVNFFSNISSIEEFNLKKLQFRAVDVDWSENSLQDLRNSREFSYQSYRGGNMTKLFKKFFKNNLNLEDIRFRRTPFEEIDLDFTTLPKLKRIDLEYCGCVSDYTNYIKDETSMTIQEFQDHIDESCKK